jgi:glutaredoxin
MKQLMLLVSLLVMANVQAADLYRSIDKDGKVHYSDTPLPDSEDVVKLKSNILPDPDEGLPYETLQAKQNFPVTLYTFPDCGPLCNQARDFLVKRGIPFSEKSLVKSEDIDEFSKASGGIEVPKLLVGKTWTRGFQAEQWNKELDFAGYPKIAPYRPQPAKPSPPPAETNPDQAT